MASSTEIVDMCINAMRRAGGVVPCDKLSLEALMDACDVHLLEKQGCRRDEQLVDLLEKHPTKFHLTPDKKGVVLTEVINNEEVRLESSNFRGLAQFLASDIATYNGLLTITRLSGHTNNVSISTFKQANVIKGNFSSIAAFLASFPSLFWLDRNLVHVNPEWWTVLWPPLQASRVQEQQTPQKDVPHSSNDTMSGQNSATSGTRSTKTLVNKELIEVCVQFLKKYGGMMSKKLLLNRIQNSGQSDKYLQSLQPNSGNRLLERLADSPTVFQLTPDKTGVILTELLSEEKKRLANPYLQDIIKAVASKLVACEGIPLPVAAISGCICLCEELSSSTFKYANVPREDSGCLSAFLLSFPSLFVFDSNTYSGCVGLKKGWRGVLHSAGVTLTLNLNSEPTLSPPQPPDEEQRAHNEKFQFCINTLQNHGGTISFDELVTEFQKSFDCSVESWTELQHQFSAVLLKHPFHFLLTADKRGVVLRAVFSKERERLTAPAVKEFVKHTAIDLAADDGALPVTVLSHHLLRLSDETFRNANVQKGDRGSLVAMLASFPSVFCFDTTGAVVSLTKNWLSVSRCAARTELVKTSNSDNCTEAAAWSSERHDGPSAKENYSHTRTARSPQATREDNSVRTEDSSSVGNREGVQHPKQVGSPRNPSTTVDAPVERQEIFREREQATQTASPRTSNTTADEPVQKQRLSRGSCGDRDEGKSTTSSRRLTSTANNSEQKRESTYIPQESLSRNLKAVLASFPPGCKRYVNKISWIVSLPS